MPISKDFVVTSRYPGVFITDISLPQFALEEFQSHGCKTAFVSRMLRICTFNLFLAVKIIGGIFHGVIILEKSGGIPQSDIKELERQYSSLPVKFIVTEEEVLPKILNVVPKVLHGFQKIITIGQPRQTCYSNIDTLPELIKLGRTSNKPELLQVVDTKNDTAFILYSSGTTGLPKGVMLTHENLVAQVCQTTLCRQAPNPSKESKFMPMPHKEDVVYTPFPYFHISGIHSGLLWPLINGATVICMPKYRPEEFLFNVEKYQVSVMLLPPPIMVFLAKSQLVSKYDLSTVRLILSAAAPLSKEIALQALKQLNDVPQVVQALGITEMSGLCTSTPLNQKARDKLASCGTLLPGTSCKVVSIETGKNCVPKQMGELWMRGPQMMNGYLNDPQATADTITHDGWLKTGDVGYFDEDEYFYISDRLKEFIKVKGFQVAPAELEALLLTHPSVDEAIVIGIPDTYSGELPRAYVALKDGHHGVTEYDIQNYVRDYLSSYKRLAGGVVFVKTVPKSPVGKLLRQILRKQVKAEFETKSKL